MRNYSKDYEFSEDPLKVAHFMDSIFLTDTYLRIYYDSYDKQSLRIEIDQTDVKGRNYTTVLRVKLKKLDDFIDCLTYAT